MKKTEDSTQQSNPIKVQRKHLGRDDLRAMEVGQTIEFVFDDPTKLEPARTTTGQMRIFGMKFSTQFNIPRSSIVVTRVQ